MEIEQKQWTEDSGWINVSQSDLSNTAQLVLAFGCKEALENEHRFQEIRDFYPNANIVICSTAGEILDNKVCDNSINTTAVSFETTRVEVSQVSISDSNESFDAGIQLMEALKETDLVYSLVISDGQIVNGSELTRALGQNFHPDITITGGLAGDGPNFQTTLVGLNEAPKSGNIVGIGFYGKNLKVGHAAKGGWDPFGPERLVTKSKNNVLYELDGQSALDLYKNYL
ncbi:MAG: FIST N-terminal domain-containing protein, partial [Cyclobacteriaceae bacterium]